MKRKRYPLFVLRVLRADAQGFSALTTEIDGSSSGGLSPNRSVLEEMDAIERKIVSRST